MHSTLLRTNINEIRNEIVSILGRLPTNFDAVSKHISFSERVLPSKYVISRFSICPDNRNLGVGNTLIRHLIDQIGDYDVMLTVIKDNVSAIRLYEKNGFEVIDEIYGYGDKQKNGYVVCLIMKKG